MALESNAAPPNFFQHMPTTPFLLTHHQTLARLVLIATDMSMVTLAFGLAYWLRFDVKVALSPEVQPIAEEYLLLIAMLVPLWIVLFALMRLYDFQYLLGGTTEYARAMNACTSGMMIVIILGFITRDIQIARAWLIMSWMLSLFFVCSGRFVLRRIAYWLRRRGLFVAKALIIGTNSEAVLLGQQLGESSATGVALMGHVSTKETPRLENEELDIDTLEDTLETVGTNTDAEAQNGNHAHELPAILGTLKDVPALVQEHGVTEVIVAASALSREELIELTQELINLPGVHLRISSGLYEVLTTGMTITTRGSVPLLSPNRLRLDPVELLVKTLLDYFVILTAFVFLLPIFAVIALLIKLDSPGPVFHPRRVIGLGGHEFDALKFRTMYVNGDEILARYPELVAELRAAHKLKDDPRVTRVGTWLRRTSLDELPQLINVLRGQMSLVGPRMISPAETAEYGEQHLNLVTVKPGLTGLWQVSGRSDLSYAERVRLDMHYIRNYSVWTDIQILFVQTIPAVLRRRGAY